VLNTYTNVMHVHRTEARDRITITKVIWQQMESLCNIHETTRLYSPGGSIGLSVW